MVRLDIGNDGDFRRVAQQRGVGLVGLGDEGLAGALVGVRARAVELAADGKGRVEARGLQRGDGHGGRGGLAMGAGEEHLVVAHHELGEEVGAADDGDAVFTRTGELRVVLRDGRERGDDDGGQRACEGEVLRGMADRDMCTDGAQDLHGRGVLHVGAGDDAAALDENAGEAGHAGAADAHHVDTGEIRTERSRGGSLGSGHGLIRPFLQKPQRR